MSYTSTTVILESEHGQTTSYIESGAATSIECDGLQPDTTYTASVEIVANGETFYSDNQESFTTLSAGSFEFVIEGSEFHPDTMAITAMWAYTSTYPLTRALVHISDDPNFVGEEVFVALINGYEYGDFSTEGHIELSAVSQWVSGVEYYYYVEGFDMYGESDISQTETIQTDF